MVDVVVTYITHYALQTPHVMGQLERTELFLHLALVFFLATHLHVAVFLRFLLNLPVVSKHWHPV
jgi:hypothetical protein